MGSNSFSDSALAQKAANNIRVLSVAMVDEASSGHPGGSAGAADFIQILFSEYLRFNPDDASWFYRDRFFLDPGHMSAMLYSTLSLVGWYSMDEVKAFRSWGSPTPGHPEKDTARGIENVSGPLGQGHTNAVGAAIAERFFAERFGEWMSHKTVAFISDGGIQEEIAQGAGRLAGDLGLNNLIMYYDANNVQLSSTVDDVTTEDIQMKYEAWGWKVYDIDGHNQDQIRESLDKAYAETEKPTLIIGRTIMGQGVVDADGNPMEDKVSLHGKPISKAGASLSKTVETLGGDPANPFQIFNEVKEYYSKALDEKREYVSAFEKSKSDWTDSNPELAKKLDLFLTQDFSNIDLSNFEQPSSTATRDASGKFLGHLYDQYENVIVTSADLSNSDKTDGFLKKTTIFRKGDFSGNFLQIGVSELTMAAVSNGIALHGGILPVCATFFVFSDYMKPAVRLAAIMEIQVVYVWTHDSFRVGEDGPTHQPIEHEAQLRLMEELKNHSGKNSLLVLRPADAEETTVAWDLALKNSNSPTALILSRQGIKSIPANGNSSRLEQAAHAEQGAYVAYETSTDYKAVLIASGSEVSTLVGAADILFEEKGIGCRVVSIPSSGVFANQSDSYKKSILTDDVKVLGLTAGLPSTLALLTGGINNVFGLPHFGYSASAEVLDDKFGFTPEKVATWLSEKLS
ncbi:MAG: transketolase [Balneolaceae bacterium]